MKTDLKWFLLFPFLLPYYKYQSYEFFHSSSTLWFSNICYSNNLLLNNQNIFYDFSKRFSFSIFTSYLSHQFCLKQKTHLLEILLLAWDASAEFVRRYEWSNSLSWLKLYSQQLALAFISVLFKLRSSA